jgi:Predicted divalent heavy-metal cations transporter
MCRKGWRLRWYWPGPGCRGAGRRWLGRLPGLVEPLFAVLCAWLIGISRMFLPWGLAAAAGAMLYVVVREIIPESQRRGHAAQATQGLIIGFCLMMVLDTSLG